MIASFRSAQPHSLVPAPRLAICRLRHRRSSTPRLLNATWEESDNDVISPTTRERFARLEAGEESEEETAGAVEQDAPPPAPFPEYRIPHRFVGFDPRRMDLEGFPRLRTDFDGKAGRLLWMGTECQRCGLQIRRERRTNRETSLNVYAHPGIPDDLLRHCPEQKSYPVLWRTRDPYIALDILDVKDF